jgi:hypothetical protein
VPPPSAAGEAGATSATAGGGGATQPTAGHGAVPTSAAGEGGTNPSAGGEGGAGLCGPPYEDCDESPLNGCEANLWNDPSNCGRCGSPCDGVCSRFGCHEAERFLDPVTSFNSIAMGENHVYLLTGNTIENPVRLWRVDKAERSEQLVADELPWFEQVTVANERIYLYGRGVNLWSGNEAGDFIDEGIEVDSIAASGGVLYADREGTLVAQKEGESTWTPQPWMTHATGSAKLWPIDVSNQLCVVRETGLGPSGESFVEYELLRVDRPDLPDGGLVPLARGAGELVRLRSQHGSVYFLVYEESGLLQLFKRDVRGNTRIQVLASGTRIGDFAVDSSSVYVTHSTRLGYALDVMPALGNGDPVRLGVPSSMSSPETDGNHLWYFGWERLERVQLPFDAP